MNSLRGRIVALCALIALISTAACALAASRTIGSGHVLTLNSQLAIFLAGLASAVVALIIGTFLGLSWIRPILVLADACRLRAADPNQPIPRVSGLAEAEVLAEGLQTLVAAQRASQEALAQALERETIANAVHQRFLTQLGQEFGQPIRVIINTIDQLHAHDGRLEPDQVIASRQAALQLEERFQEVLGLAADHVDPTSAISRRALDSYVSGIAELLRPVATRRGVTLTTSASNSLIPIDARLLTPVLVNLTSNAIKAAGTGTVGISAEVNGTQSVWRVRDTGSGIAADLAKRISDACQRGEVLPGEPGLGLGLSLALANTRALGGTLRLVENGPGGATFELRFSITLESTSWRRKRADVER